MSNDFDVYEAEARGAVRALKIAATFPAANRVNLDGSSDGKTWLTALAEEFSWSLVFAMEDVDKPFEYPEVQHITSDGKVALCGVPIPNVYDVPADWFDVMKDKPFCPKCEELDV
jgi:hypothetical protein